MKTTTLTFRVPVEVKTHIINKAAQEDITVSALLLRLLMEQGITTMDEGGEVKPSIQEQILKTLQETAKNQTHFHDVLLWGLPNRDKDGKLKTDALEGVSSLNKYLDRMLKQAENSNDLQVELLAAIKELKPQTTNKTYMKKIPPEKPAKEKK